MLVVELSGCLHSQGILVKEKGPRVSDLEPEQACCAEVAARKQSWLCLGLTNPEELLGRASLPPSHQQCLCHSMVPLG